MEFRMEKNRLHHDDWGRVRGAMHCISHAFAEGHGGITVNGEDYKDVGSISDPEDVAESLKLLYDFAKFLGYPVEEAFKHE